MFELLRLNLGIGVTKEDETSVHDFFSKAIIKRDFERRLAKYANEPNYKYRIEVKKLKHNITYGKLLPPSNGTTIQDKEKNFCIKNRQNLLSVIG